MVAPSTEEKIPNLRFFRLTQFSLTLEFLLNFSHFKYFSQRQILLFFFYCKNYKKMDFDENVVIGKLRIQ